jgi:protease I
MGAFVTYDLTDRQIAVLATHGYERSELERPVAALKEAGADVHVVSPQDGTIQGWADGNWSGSQNVDRTLDETSADHYDGLVLPGGVINPDSLRTDSGAVRFVRDFFDEGKPVAAICHGPWMIVEADAADGREMTSWPSIRTDMENAGAHWIDDEVVVDQGLVTSRSPADLDAFCHKLVEEMWEGVHEGQTL